MSAVDKMRAKHAAEMAAAKIEDEIMVALPASLQEAVTQIHVSSLYGRVASIRFEGAGYPAAPLSFEFVSSVVAALPPVATVLVKDSCSSFKTRAYVDALPEEKKVSWKEEIDVSPIRLDVAAHPSGRGAELEWFARVPGTEHIVDVSCRIGEPSSVRALVDYFPGRKAHRSRGVDYTAEPARLTLTDEMHHAMSEGEAIAQAESPIRWWVGDGEPGKFTLYFIDLGCDMDPSVVGTAIVAHMATLVAKGEAKK